MYVKCCLLFLMAAYTKQDCTFSNNTFSCVENEMENIIYEFNLKAPEDSEIFMIEIVDSDFAIIDNFFNFLDNLKKEKISQIRIINSRVKQVKENAFKQYPALTVLDLSNNQIEDMTFVKSLPEVITELHLSKNSFTIIDDTFEKLKKLRYIDLSFCKLEEIDFTIFKDVDSIDLVNISNNIIQNSMSKKFVKNIKCIDISCNNLTRYDNIPSFCLDFSHTNMSVFRWYNISEKNESIFVSKFYYVGNADLKINATNINKNLIDIQIGHLNVSEYKSNVSDLQMTKVKVTKAFILKDSNVPLLDKKVYDFKELFYEANPNTTFDLSNNSLTEISEGYFEKYNLRVLNLCYNNLMTLKSNVFHEANFEQLLLCRGGLESIDNFAFNELMVKKLNLSHNKLHELNFLNRIKDLEHLDLSYNLIEFISLGAFSNLNDLVIINLSDNLIGAVEAGVFNTAKLVEINLRNNHLSVIKSLSFSNSPNLSRLLLEGNRITAIQGSSFKSLPKLVLLNLANMNFVDLQPASFLDMQNLRVLYLNNSNITVLPQDLFVSVPNLKYIYLHNNDINSLSALKELSLDVLVISLVDEIEDGYFNIPQVKSLCITDSNIEVLHESFFLGLYNLRELHLKNSVVNSYQPSSFRGLFQLQYLDPQFFSNITVLQAYTFRDLMSLQRLDLSNLNIKVIEPQAFYGLGKLDELLFQNNNIVVLNDNVFVGLVNVRTLNLSRNNISQLCVGTFAGLGSLRKLLLNENGIASIPLGTLQNVGTLEVLNLAGNKITQVTVGTFSQLKNLRRLDLSFNEIRSLCDPLLFPLESLRELYLTGNLLHESNELIGVGKLPQLRLIDINQNRFGCDDLVVILSGLENRNVTVYFEIRHNFETENVNGIACINTCIN